MPVCVRAIWPIGNDYSFSEALLIQTRQLNLYSIASRRFHDDINSFGNSQRRVNDLKRGARGFSYRCRRSNCRPVGVAKDTNPRNHFGLTLNAVEAAGLIFDNPFPPDAEPHLASWAAIMLNGVLGTDHEGSMRLNLVIT
jgi:hypothetical protein